MRVRPPLRVGVTRHDEKELKLKEFVRHHLAPSSVRTVSAQEALTVVARSPDSPVIKALLGLANEIDAAGLGLRVIFAYLDNDGLPESWEKDLGPLRCDVRWARRPRLIEAHEQLVIGPLTCWIGDCMRRDPAKCDAFENYVEDCGEAAGCATVSFERLWIASEGVKRLGPPPPVVSPEAIPGAEASQASVGTRH